MNIYEHLLRPAQLFPERVAIVFEGRQFTYARLVEQVASAANQLQVLGIAPGDRVALMLPNIPAFAVWYYATLRLGAVAVSVSTRLNPKEVGFIVSDCGAELLITDLASSQAVAQEMAAQESEWGLPVLAVSDLGDPCDGRQLPAASAAQESSYVDTNPDEPALILYTSGTTGFAKGATLSHRNVRATVHAFNHLCGMRTEDRILLAVPLFHCYGQNALLNSGLNVGATLVLQRRFDLHESKRLIADERVTKLFGVPTSFQLLVEYCDPADLQSIEYCFSAAATLPIQLSRRWHEKFGIPIYEGYGLTETSPFASYNHGLKFVPGSVGTPVDNVELKIVDTATGQTCPPGELGEIAIRGPNVMLGYWNRPRETEDVMRGGWFHSGDIGRVDEQGYLYIVDRVKDMITIGGSKVFPAEVERILLDHPAVLDVAVVGFPDEVFGEKAVAFVVRNDQANAGSSESWGAELKSHCLLYLADFKVPKRFQFVDELPRNPAGKVLKTKLRETTLPFTTSNSSATQKVQRSVAIDEPIATTAELSTPFRDRIRRLHPSARQHEITSLIQSELAEILDAERVPGVMDSFLEGGLDSIAIVELRDRLQMQLGSHLELPATLVFDYPRICDMATYLADALSCDDANSREDAMQAANSRLPTGASQSFRHHVQTVRDSESSIASMTEEEALDELLREIEE